MAIIKFLNANNQWESIDMSGVVKYTEQSLSEEQQAQAINNLGIDLAIKTLLNMIDNVGYIDAGNITQEEGDVNG